MSLNPMTSSFGPVITDDVRGVVTSSSTYRADYVDEPILRHTGTTTTLPTTGDNALYYHRNQQYSIVGLTNAAGTLVERYTYSAYGTLGIYAANGTVRSSSTYANRYTYTGREWDAELKLYYFRARWYDPATGGFVTRDPLGYVDGMSLYRGYFGVKQIDPYGSFVSTAANTADIDTNPHRKGTFNIKLNDCTGELLTQTGWFGRPNCGCCTDAVILYRASDKEFATYKEIYLYQWAWSRKSFRGGTCNGIPGFNDPWHPDPPGKDESAPAKPPTSRIAKMTDAPAHYFQMGWFCGDGCSENYGRQDFETCAIGILPSGRHVNLGCIHWGHECDVEYFLEASFFDPIITNTGVTHCVNHCGCRSEIRRYPRGDIDSIPPVSQKPMTWDPYHDPTTQPM